MSCAIEEAIIKQLDRFGSLSAVQLRKLTEQKVSGVVEALARLMQRGVVVRRKANGRAVDGALFLYHKTDPN